MGIIRTTANTASLFALTVLLAACAVSYIDTRQELNLPQLEAISTDLPSISGLDDTRDASTVQQVPVEPIQYTLSGGQIFEQGKFLLLDSAAESSSWAMYAYPTQGNALFNLSLTFTYPNGPGALVALANFETGRWEWKPKIQLTQAIYSISPTVNRNYTSPQGNLYFVVVSYGNQDVQITDLKVIVDIPPAPTFTISGRVTDENSGPVSGILIGLSVGDASTSTDANGNYSFAGMAPGNYALTPQAADTNFSPQFHNANVVSKDVGDLNFVATPVVVLVTYVVDIAPLIDGSTGEKSCLECHSGQFPEGDLDFSTYPVVRDNADIMNTEVNRNFEWMPKDGDKWSQENLDLFQAWIDGGKLEN
jgi:hypothetical protein